MPADAPAKCFGFVQCYDRKPKRRLFEVLRSQGMRPNQQVTFLTDGGDDVRELPLYLNPQSQHLLDWFHITMRLTVLSQMAKGVRSRENPSLTDELTEELERLKWYLWHGNVFLALQTTTFVQLDIDNVEVSPEQQKLSKAIAEFGGYIRAKRGVDPELRRAVPIRRSDLQRVRRVSREPGRQQAHGQEAADALDTVRRSSPPPGAHSRPERRARRCLSALVPSVRRCLSWHGPDRTGGLTSHGFSRSPAVLRAELAQQSATSRRLAKRPKTVAFAPTTLGTADCAVVDGGDKSAPLLVLALRHSDR